MSNYMTSGQVKDHGIHIYKHTSLYVYIVYGAYSPVSLNSHIHSYIYPIQLIQVICNVVWPITHV